MRTMRLTNRAVAQAVEAYRTVTKPTDGKGWYRIKNLSGAAGGSGGGFGDVEIYLYDEIGLWGVTAADLIRELAMLQAGHIDLRINSPGGDVWDGIAIYNALCNHSASVTTYIDGLAASAASFIAQAGSKVMIARNGTMMIHDAEGICIGNAADMTEMATLLDRTSDNIADIYAQRVSTVNVWRKAMRGMTWYIGDEAVKAGLADEVYEPVQGTDDEPAERRRRAAAPATANQTMSTIGAATRQPRPVSTACPPHGTATTDEGSWDASGETGRLPSPMPIATARKVYGWYDSDRVEDGKPPKDACKLPHHVVGENGTPGAAHLGGVRNALSRLSQSDIPSGEQDAVRNHLQAHLDDAGEDSESGEDDDTTDSNSVSITDGNDVATWWDPDVFRAAVGTAADQHNLYGFNADAFREIMRAAAEDAPAPSEPVPVPTEIPEPVRPIDQSGFYEALRRGML